MWIKGEMVKRVVMEVRKANRERTEKVTARDNESEGNKARRTNYKEK